MLERFKRTGDPGAEERETGTVATADRTDDTYVEPADPADTAVREPDERTEETERPLTRTGDGSTTGAATTAALETARARQRAKFGGVNWGASFFGWLVAVGVAALLTSLLVAGGAAIGLTESDVTNDADEITFGGGVALVAVVLIAYYTGGYVAGRMSRFDGGRQGLATWAIGLIVTVGLALAAVIFGDEYNVLEQLNLPSIPVGDETLTTGGIIASAAIVIGSALLAMAGGKLGERYHRRVDRFGFVD